MQSQGMAFTDLRETEPLSNSSARTVKIVARTIPIALSGTFLALLFSNSLAAG